MSEQIDRAPACLRCGRPVIDQATKPSAVYAVHIDCLLDEDADEFEDGDDADPGAELDMFVTDDGGAAELVGVGARKWLRSDRLVEVRR